MEVLSVVIVITQRIAHIPRTTLCNVHASLRIIVHTDFVLAMRSDEESVSPSLTYIVRRTQDLCHARRFGRQQNIAQSGG